jgi:SAM-dependent methyltransferase
MRRQHTLSRVYFDDLYARSCDPWQFATSDYERQKYEQTACAIGSGHGEALEIGCSIGIFTQCLASRCRQLLAIDIAERALDAARENCRGYDNVRFRLMHVPDELPASRFDLIVLSEVGYYWSAPDLDRFIDWLGRGLSPTGLLVLVHWTGETDYPMTADEVHERVLGETRTFLRLETHMRAGLYRLDTLAGRDRPLACSATP